MRKHRVLLLLLVLFLLYVSVPVRVRRADPIEFLPTPTVEYRRADISVDAEGVAGTFNVKKYCRLPRVAAIVSPSIERFIQVYWDVDFVQNGDWIALYSRDPEIYKNASSIFQFEVETSTGIATTNYTARQFNSSILKYTAQCLGFWTVYYTKDTVVTFSCLQTYPTWMYDMKEQLHHMSLTSLFIPGTHDSGSFDGQDSFSTINVIDRFVFTQEEDIRSQLIHGIRYLDLRVSSNAGLDDRWWINHGYYRIQPLKHILNDVKHFMNNTKEIVILDFHEFPGFDENIQEHLDLVHYVYSELSEWMAFPRWNTSCGELWNSNKTLIISYNNDVVVKILHMVLWPPIVQKWANVQHNEDLKRYIKKIIENRPYCSWAAMAELTPNIWKFFSYEGRGLRKMAQEVNVHVTNWFRGTWGRACNIVAVDFFKGTDIIYSAIEWNTRRTKVFQLCDIP